ncbi:immunity 49 family protein [Streptomyces sp. NPDC019443]|uniref:immunity 49 family protein n=1 Tax=Streptomyces sp. NPDC019443 TaxID=3365061 RepID=UPI003792FEFA
MTELCEIPLDVLRASGTEYDEFVYLWIDALQTYWLERPGLSDKLVAAIEASYAANIQVADMELVERILYQPLNIFHRFLRKDREGFNQALVEALEIKVYWTASEKRERSVAGYLALGPLAIACLAYDAAFPIEVESDYLPSELLNRACLVSSPHEPTARPRPLLPSAEPCSGSSRDSRQHGLAVTARSTSAGAGSSPWSM